MTCAWQDPFWRMKKNDKHRLPPCQPRRFEVAFETIDLFGGNAVVRPTHLSICNADMRYYLGTRDAKVLAQKLPMALIHEGIGRVVLDSTGRFKCGDKVVMIPIFPAKQTRILRRITCAPPNSAVLPQTAFCRNMWRSPLQGSLPCRKTSI